MPPPYDRSNTLRSCPHQRPASHNDDIPQWRTIDTWGPSEPEDSGPTWALAIVAILSFLGALWLALSLWSWGRQVLHALGVG